MAERAAAVSPPTADQLTRSIAALSGLGAWAQRSLCAGESPDIFFPAHGDPGFRARQICAACPVLPDCLLYAIRADEIGIWGGLDQAERRNLRSGTRQRTTVARAGNVAAGALNGAEGAA